MLNIETGLGSQDADAYISVEDADARFDGRGLSLWSSMSQGDKERAIRRATDHMTQTYRTKWRGQRVSRTQALDWPRSGVTVDGFDVASDVVPQDIANACAELAFRGAFGELTKDVGRLKQSVTVGPITTVYAAGSSAQTKFTAVDNMLTPYLSGKGGQIKLVRA